MRGAGPIRGTQYVPASMHLYYSILDAVETTAPGDEDKQSSLAQEIVEAVFDIIEDTFNRLADEPTGGFDEEKDPEMARIAMEFRSVDNKQDLDRWLGQFVRAGIVAVLPETKHTAPVIRDKFAARGFRSVLITAHAIQIEDGKPRPEEEPSKLKSAMGRAEQKVKGQVDSAVTAKNKKVSSGAGLLNKTREYMLVRGPASGELSPLSNDIFDKWPMEDGERFRAGKEIDNLNRFNFAKGKAEDFLKELIQKGLVQDAPKEVDPSELSDIRDVDTDDARFAAQDYAAKHFDTGSMRDWD